MSDAARRAQLAALQRRRVRVIVPLCAAALALYFGFILAVAFAPSTLGALVAPGLSLGILLGAAVIVLSWGLTALYVRWANRHYDPALRALREAERAPRDG